MNQHPENGEELNKLLEFVESQELVDVWCNGCGCFRRMNSVFSKYLDGEINSCMKCRDKD